MFKMSAPMVPQHHKRQEVCDSRAAYREGRHSKAVKVYTVNQESCYLLVTGVPAVGGCQELVKLFAVYGAVEEYRVLDDYPCEEFTETYLFKFKKIQSARFAKRKLDDYSFFGGVLHVCYAPEYESVEETRFKLQDRRRVIAAKIRQHATSTENASEVYSTTQSDQHMDTNVPSTSEQSSETHTRCAEQQIHEQEHHIAPTDLEQSLFLDTDGNVMNSQREDNSHVPFMNLELPPPPLNMAPPRHRHPPVRPSNYGYAWVPSSHSTLPSLYNKSSNLNQNPGSTEIPQADLTLPIYSKYLKTNDSQKTQPTPKKFDEGKNKTVNGLVVKEYKKPGKVPKFVPRQAVKKTSEKNNSKPKSETDAVNKELRANAFTLGQSQGPTMPGKDDQKVKVHPAAEKAVNQTVKDIRKRISKFISEKIPPPKKSKLASGQEEKT